MPAITDVTSKRVLFGNGFAIDDTDFNNAQKFLLDQVLDNLLISAVPDAIDEDPSSLGLPRDLELGRSWNSVMGVTGDLVFAPFAGCGYVRAHTVANQLICVPGPLVFVVDEPFAGDERIALFRLDSTILTTANGDATNPRIDLVECKAEFINSDSQTRHFEDAVTRAKSSQSSNTTRRVQLTIQIKAGTPAATPAYPAPSAGFVPIAAVKVPATHNAVHSPDNIRDLRMPLGNVVPYDVNANQMWLPGANPWVLTQGNPSPAMYLAGPGSSNGDAYAVCPVTAKNARLVGVGLYGALAGTAALVRLDHNLPSGPTITTLADLAGTYPIVGGSAGFREVNMAQLMDLLGATGLPFQGTRATNTRIGSPMWCSGHAAGAARPITAAAETPHGQLAVKVNGASGDRLSFVRFYVAHGM